MLLFGDDCRRRVSFCAFAKAHFKIRTWGDTAYQNDHSGHFDRANIRDRTARLRRGFDMRNKIAKKENGCLSIRFLFLVTRTGIEPMLQP